MHRHKKFRYGPRLFRPWGFRGGIWLIFLAIMLLRGNWWPGILVLIGLSIVFGALFREETPNQNQNPPPAVTEIPHPVQPTVAAAPVEQIHPSELLPVTCSHCGGPIRSYEVKWTGKQSAACPYCGSNLTLRKT